MKLLDSNIWVGAFYAFHKDHDIARRWLDDADDDLAFCRVTQMAVLRHLSDPAVLGKDALTRSRSWEILLTLQADPRMHFLHEPANLVPLWMTYSKRDDRSHQLWTDDYLAAFAQAGDLELVTLDKKMPARYPAVRVEVIR